MTDRKDQPFDIVQKPRHYNTHPSGIEAVEICELLPFNIGNALKYVWRAGQKDDRKQDLKKAVWYLRRQPELKIDSRLIILFKVQALADAVLEVEPPDSILYAFLDLMLDDPSSPSWPRELADLIEREIGK